MLFKNPIFLREMKGAIRDPKIVLLIIGYVALLSVILMFLWPTSGIFSLASESSLNIFTIFLMSNLALILLLVPALTSPAITSERENNSFDLLFTSLMKPSEILLGKLFATITMILLVILVSMPVAALCALSGGIGPPLLLRAYFIILLSAVTYGMLGLALSAVCKQTFTALILCYVLVAILAGSTWLPYYLLGRLSDLSGVWLLIRSLSPFDAIYSLVFPERYGLTQLTQTGGGHLTTFYVHAAGMLAMLAFFFFIFWRYIFAPPKAGLLYRWSAYALVPVFLLIVGIEWSLYKRFDADPMLFGWEVSDFQFYALIALIDASLLIVMWRLFRLSFTVDVKYHDQFDDMGTVVKRKLHWPFYLIDPLKRKKPIRSWQNPVFLAELRSKVFGNPKFLIRGVAGCFIAIMALLVLICFQYGNYLKQDVVRWVAVVFQLGIVAILAPAISSGSITDEITSRTFKMLRMTPISATRVVSGKLKAGFLYVSIFLLSSLPILLALAYLDTTRDEFNMQTLWRVGAWFIIMLFSTLAFITAGFCASAFSKTTSGATAVSYTFAGIICIVSFAALIPGAFTVATQEAILQVNPIVAALRVTSDEMFAQLSPNIWMRNIAFLVSVSVIFIVASSIRVYSIFTRQV